MGSFDSHIGNVEHIKLFSYSLNFTLQRAFGIYSEEEARSVLTRTWRGRREAAKSGPDCPYFSRSSNIIDIRPVIEFPHWLWNMNFSVGMLYQKGWS